MKYTIQIDCGNAAFGEHLDSAGHEVARILRDLADGIEQRGLNDEPRQPRDFNGNRVGKATVTGVAKWQRDRRRDDD